jgi:hypothetical protein
VPALSLTAEEVPLFVDVVVQGVMISGAESVAAMMAAAATAVAAVLPAIGTAALPAGGGVVPARMDDAAADPYGRHQGERSGTAESSEHDFNSRSLHDLSTPHHQ